MFSEAISSIWFCWRTSSRWIAPASSGSLSASRRCEEAVLCGGRFAAGGHDFSFPGLVHDNLATRRAWRPPSKDVERKVLRQSLAASVPSKRPPMRQHIGVVVLAREPRGGDVVAQRGAHLAVAVGGDRHADAGAADEQAAPRLAGLHRSRHLLGEVGIIDRLRAVGAEIEHVKSQSAQLRQKNGFQLIAAMIGGDGDDFSHDPGRNKSQRRLYQISASGVSRLPSIGSAFADHPRPAMKPPSWPD